MTNPTNPINRVVSNAAQQSSSRQTIRAGDSSRVTEVQQAVKRQQTGLAVQTIATGKDSQLEGVSQEANFQTSINIAEQSFYFDMQLLKVSIDETENESLIEIKPEDLLEPGATYVVRIAINRDQYRWDESVHTWKMSQQGVKTRGNVRFFVQEPITGQAIETNDIIGIYIPEEYDAEWYGELRITVKETHSLNATQLQLMYKTPNGVIRLATRLEVNLRRATEKITLPDEMRCYLNIQGEPPDQTAILHIYPTGENQVNCVRWFKEQKDDPKSFPPLDLPAIFPRENSNFLDYLEAIEQTLNNLAYSNAANVGCWFEDVLSRYGSNCCIVLVDQTEVQLPWEMFKLSGARYLGAEVVVVRWLVEQFRGKNVQLLLERSEQEGHVMVYRSSQLAERSILNQLKHQSCDRITQLPSSLVHKGNRSVAGLVYLSCPNVLTTGDEAAALTRLGDTEGRSIKLTFDDVEGLVRQRPIFLVTAPYSGRLLSSAGKTCGFVKATLTLVASGYIGTLANVPPKIGDQVIEIFLRAASTQTGVNPAEFLKRLREKCVSDYQQTQRNGNPEKIDQKKRLLLYVFTFIYYGNSQARLKLVPFGSSSIGREVS